MKILKILFSCFAVLVLSAFFVFELIFARSVDNSLSAYAEENITSDSVEPLSGDDPDPSINDYHWDLSGFDQYNLNLAYEPDFVISNSTINNSAHPIQLGAGDYSISISGATFPTGQWQIIINDIVVFTFNLTTNLQAPFSLSTPSSFRIYANNGSPNAKIMLVKGSYTAETMPAYQPNLKYIFTTGFTNGYRDGYDTGYDSGRNYGYNLGYISGYDTGYSYGRNSQISEGLFKNPLDVFLQPISNFLNTDIFGSFSIGDGFTIAFFVMIALIFIKMFAGG